MNLQHSNQQLATKKLQLLGAFVISKYLKYVVLVFIILIASTIFLFTLDGPYDRHSIFRFGFLPRLLPTDDHKQKQAWHGACDYSKGKWVPDESYASQFYNESCPFLDPGFQCIRNGRRDEGYRKWKWQPDDCVLPSFNATDLLERSRNGRIVFAGDSIGRNQWESLLCMLAQAGSNLSTIHEVNGKPISKHKGFLSMRFEQYNLTVEYYRAPFLSTIGRPSPNSPSEVRGTIRLDELHWYSKYWTAADLLIFNTGHWWNSDKTVKMGNYFQEGGQVNRTMDVTEAFNRAMQTLKKWALANLDPEKTHVFFRSYSPSHYRNGTWNSGGECHTDQKPEKNIAQLQEEPYNNKIIFNVIEQVKHENLKFQFLNITYLSEIRKDGHPSKYREPGTPPEAPEDCSHWCLPGIPDTWNQIIYAHLLRNKFIKN